MKNIHILPTDKPSNLLFEKISNRYYTNSRGKENSKNVQNQNIYITSDEEIEEDWFIDNNNSLRKSYKLSHVQFANPKKIILTTDPDLIKDGVQAIDDEFIEWFVKNPSYEEVKVVLEKHSEDEWIDDDFGGETYTFEYENYKIIIPKEEPKQETTADYIDRHIVEALVEVAKQKLYSEEDLKNTFFSGFNLKDK